jgi:shikimate kinase
MKNHTNIVLIGMPGSGKSTVGVILAKQTARSFIDTDLLFQLSEERSLQDIIDAEGHIALRQIEEDVLLAIADAHHVIATGGSAAYSAPAMDHLKKIGVLVFLDVSLQDLEGRVGDFGKRGIAKRPDQTFADLFEERFVLYSKHADITISCDGLTQEEVCDRIQDLTSHLPVRVD